MVSQSFLACLRSFAHGLPFLLLCPSLATAALPKVVTSPIDQMYVPTDYDDNDNVEVIVFGYFPNSCYKTGPISHELSKDGDTIKIKASSYLYEQSDRVCADVRIPFTQKVQLGFLPAGKFQLELVGSEIKTSSLSIKEGQASSSDDFLYAPVESVRLTKEERNLTAPDTAAPDTGATAILYGTYPRMLVGCMVMRKVQLTRERDDIVVLRPIAEILEGEACADQQKLDFMVEVPLPADLPNQTLVHVRATNGNAHNQIYFTAP